jgi:hypothetical protein
VVGRDCVQELGSHLRFESRGAFLDEAQAKMNVAEEAALVRLFEERRRAQLTDAAEVVEQRRRE